MFLMRLDSASSSGPSHLRLLADPLHRNAGEARATEDAAAGGREIDHPTARKRPPISDRNDDTAPISVKYDDLHGQADPKCVATKPVAILAVLTEQALAIE